MKVIAVGAIKVYQEFFSPRTGFGSGKWSCMYYPSCSQYAVDAIQNTGFLKGTLYAFLRIMRCHPWQEPRVDYFPNCAVDRKTP